MTDFNNFFNDIDPDIHHFSSLFPSFDNDKHCDYIDIKNFNESVTTNQNDFTVLCWNCRSLYPKIDEIKLTISELNCNFDIITFCESWLNETSKDMIQFDNYNSLHSLRSNGKRGGGISTYISKHIDSRLIPLATMNNDNIETLFIDLTHNGKRIVLGTIYRPPSGCHISFKNEFNRILSLFNKSLYTNILICGDFNYDLLNHENCETTSSFLNDIHSKSLLPTINKPTRISQETATLLDNILITDPTDISTGILNSDLSDHFPIFLIRKNIFTDNSLPKAESYTYRSTNESNLNKMYELLSESIPTLLADDDIINPTNIDNLMTKTTDLINTAYTHCCPIKTRIVTQKNKHKPWITRDIITNIKKRHALNMLLYEGKISSTTYNRFRNYVTNQIRTSKKNYFSFKFSQFKNDVKKTWRLLNSTYKPVNRTNNKIDSIIQNGVTINDNTDVANIFNNFFVNIGKNIAESVISGPNEHLKYMDHIQANDSFFFTPTNTHDVQEIIKKLKNKSCGLNSIPVKVLKHIADLISPILSHVFNLSLSFGIFPDSLKIARVTPIFKGGDKCSVNNYRPISILPIVSKIFEKIIYKKVYSYLETKTYLYNKQYGFRSKKSTTQAILNHLQYIYSNIDEGNFVFSVFLDFRKAFDCVDHDILLSKLNCYGIRGLALNWFRSYLTNRKQYVVIGNAKSELLNINHGVPQGSVLGPLLFLIFINDIVKSTALFDFILFADDSTLSTSYPSVNQLNITETINDELQRVSNWLKANKLCINIDKTKYMLFSYRKTSNIHGIKFGDDQISETDSTKFLGIIIDKNLTFKPHITYISSKLSKSIGILHKVKHILPEEALKILYRTLIHPYIQYGIEAWYGTNKNKSNAILVLQKKAIRAMLNLEYNANTNDSFKYLKILKLPDLYEYSLCTLLYKTLSIEGDQNLKLLVSSQIDHHEHFTRNRTKFILPYYSKSKSQFSFQFSSIKAWNSLPSNVREKNTKTEFKTSLELHLLSKY